MVQQARAEKISLDLFSSNEAYMETVRHFARDHNISEIIIAVPPVQEPLYTKLIQKGRIATKLYGKPNRHRQAKGG